MASFAIDEQFQITGRGLVFTAICPDEFATGDYFKCKRTGSIIQVGGIERFHQTWTQNKKVGILVRAPYEKGFFDDGDEFEQVELYSIGEGEGKCGGCGDWGYSIYCYYCQPYGDDYCV